MTGVVKAHPFHAIPHHSTPFHTALEWGRCSKHSTVFHLSRALWNTSHFYRCRKLRTSSVVVGIGQSHTQSAFPSSALIPCAKTLWPRKCISVQKRWVFFRLQYSLLCCRVSSMVETFWQCLGSKQDQITILSRYTWQILPMCVWRVVVTRQWIEGVFHWPASGTVIPTATAALV